MVWMWPMGHCGMDVTYETLWYGCDLWDTVVWMWPIEDTVYGCDLWELWYGCGLMGHCGMECGPMMRPCGMEVTLICDTVYVCGL